jgi:hypothetical protein
VVWLGADVDGFWLLHPLFSFSFFVTVAAGEVGVVVCISNTAWGFGIIWSLLVANGVG